MTLRDDDRTLAILDDALTLAQSALRKLLPDATPSEIAEAFTNHVQTHLWTELTNIQDHGHRLDDHDDPEAEDLSSALDYNHAQYLEDCRRKD
jgi:hypothetical protein